MKIGGESQLLVGKVNRDVRMKHRGYLQLDRAWQKLVSYPTPLQPSGSGNKTRHKHDGKDKGSSW